MQGNDSSREGTRLSSLRSISNYLAPGEFPFHSFSPFPPLLFSVLLTTRLVISHSSEYIGSDCVEMSLRQRCIPRFYSRLHGRIAVLGRIAVITISNPYRSLNPQSMDVPLFRSCPSLFHCYLLPFGPAWRVQTVLSGGLNHMQHVLQGAHARPRLIPVGRSVHWTLIKSSQPTMLPSSSIWVIPKLRVF